MNNKDKFLQKKFLYDLQIPISFFCVLFSWFIIGKIGVFIGKNVFDISFKELLDTFFVQYGVSSLSFVFGLYNLFTYIWSKTMAEKYGIELFGDLDQEWLRKEQGYDAKIFGEIYSKNLHFRKLCAKSLFITVPLSFLPWPAVSFIVGIIMIVVYMVYRKVYFNDAMADRWPRVYGSGIVISRILDQDSDFSKKDTEKNNEENK